MLRRLSGHVYPGNVMCFRDNSRRMTSVICNLTHVTVRITLSDFSIVIAMFSFLLLLPCSVFYCYCHVQFSIVIAMFSFLLLLPCSVFYCYCHVQFSIVIAMFSFLIMIRCALHFIIF